MKEKERGDGVEKNQDERMKKQKSNQHLIGRRGFYVIK